MESGKPRIGEFVLTTKGPVVIAYSAEGVVELKGQPGYRIPIADLEPSPDGRKDLWVVVPK